MLVSNCSSDSDNHYRQGFVMVAEFTAESSSPRPIAAITDSNVSAKSRRSQPAVVTDLSDRRRRALAQLEATIEGCSLANDEQLNIWTAFQDMLDAIEEPPAGDLSLTNPSLAERSSAKSVSAIASSTHAGSSLSPSQPKASTVSWLSSLRPRSVEPDIETHPTWNEVVIVLGPEIQRIRQAQGLSRHQIHFRTQVPVYQLQALESGAVSQLPEEIFVRGFLTRICAQLGEEGQALLAQLPTPQPMAQNILADWQQKPHSSSGQPQVFHLRSSHLYVSYAALLAGATGGLAWSFQETAQVAPVPDSPQQLVAPASAVKTRLNPAQRAAQLAFGSGVAQPEQSAPELRP